MAHIMRIDEMFNNMLQGYHIKTVGGDDFANQEEIDLANQIYDVLTHNQMTTDEAIDALTNGDLESDTELEHVSPNVINFGTSKDGKYFLTYDKVVGAFDVWKAK